MMSLQDKLYNWLTIKVVVDARPEDTAAAETMQMFEHLLADENGIQNPVVNVDETMYQVEVETEGKQKMYRFPRELIEVMLDQISNEPDKYVNYPNE
ncbi:hypothetical protein M3182_15005 [Mesobacillus maritimus]|uniref:hypothetical protein n=2 Tax=Mesobacillus maritimus TaxID=1643336 RepID=UPI00203F6D8A|nr:hypothetical protein [Mesobacillus maritimus]MCM3587045.1 hypothetical protein [Mesobacillus maritimus]MCM3667610.1 hypothetical protein [Mesobacillus maritimus]